MAKHATRSAVRPASASSLSPSLPFFVGAIDVQADRLVWAVWGCDRHSRQRLVGTGVLAAGTAAVAPPPKDPGAC